MRSTVSCADAFDIDVRVPAKALLFGEYGVLYGGRALVCILPQFFFDLRVKVETSNSAEMRIESEFVSQTRDAFFRKALLPWKSNLENKRITVQIKHSFDPSLGFGSSSALIAALSFALFAFVRAAIPKIDDAFLWEKIRASLKSTQGIASGYDVCAQLNFIITKNFGFFIFENQKNSVVPMINQVHLDEALISKMGCIVKTHVYSDTLRVLKNFSQHTQKERMFFAEGHARIAEMFLQNPQLSTLHACMLMSLKHSKKQKICLSFAENEALKGLEKLKIPFKTMGSGHGDCLWAAESKEVLVNSGFVKPEDIVFCFENFVNECK